jgi:hypothetical protein
MEIIKTDTALVAKCGLYCAACPKFAQNKCAGCHENQKAGWCKVRTCCLENGYASCADCNTFTDPVACKKYHNIMGRLFGLIFNSDRARCIQEIKSLGYESFACQMAKRKRMTFKRL